MRSVVYADNLPHWATAVKLCPGTGMEPVAMKKAKPATGWVRAGSIRCSFGSRPG